MTREEAKKCIKTITILYPTIYKDWKEEELKYLIENWMVQFANVDGKEVWKAIQHHASVSRFAPTIADIKEILMSDEDVMTDEEIWSHLLIAGSNGLYGAEEEWAKLPEVIRKAITPYTITEIAKCEDGDLGYIKRDVLASVHSVMRREQKDRVMVMGDRRLELAEVDFGRLMIEGANDETENIQ